MKEVKLEIKKRLWKYLRVNFILFFRREKSEVSDIRGVQVSNGFGSAKRSYVMQPYRLIKDNDSGYESSDVDGILDGNITDMLDYNLKIKRSKYGYI